MGGQEKKQHKTKEQLDYELYLQAQQFMLKENFSLKKQSPDKGSPPKGPNWRNEQAGGSSNSRDPGHAIGGTFGHLAPRGNKWNTFEKSKGVSERMTDAGQVFGGYMSAAQSGARQTGGSSLRLFFARQPALTNTTFLSSNEGRGSRSSNSGSG